MKLEEVLFVSHKYPPSTGGMEKFSYEIIAGFERAGVKVHKIIFDHSTSKIIWFYQLKNKIRKLLRENPEVNFIHVNDGLMAFFCRWIKKEFSIPISVTLHGLDVVFPVGFYQSKIFPSFGQAFDLFICVSEATSKAAIKRGLPASKIVVIRNGVDHDLAEISANMESYESLMQRLEISTLGKKVIVGLGRGVRRKGYGWFVSNVLPKLHDDILFIMLGPRTAYEHNEKWVSKMLPIRWKHNIELLLGLSTDDRLLMEAIYNPALKNKYCRPGYLKFDDICQILLHSQLFIMPNLKEENDMEGFGLVALEASILGNHVLASGIDGITDAIIQNQNGQLIPSADVNQWVSVINDLMDDSNTLKLLGQRGKAYTLSHYSWSKMVSEYIKCFNDFLNKSIPHYH